MTERRKKLAFLMDFNKICEEALMAQPKPNRSHRRRLETCRSKIHALRADPDFIEVSENRMKILNVVLHYANTGDDVQLERSSVALNEEFVVLMQRLGEKIIKEGRN